MTRQKQMRAGVALLLFMASASVGFAQFGNPFVSSNTMDTMSGGGTGAPNSSLYIGRAQAAAGAATPAPGAPPPVGGFGAPMAPVATPTPAARTGYAYGYGGYGGQPAATPATPTPTPVETVRVLAGVKVIDAVSKQLIDAPTFTDVVKNDLQGKYFDDGTHGDERAGDLMFSNVKTVDNVMGGESHRVLLRYLNALQSADQMTPLEFFRLHVLTTEITSEIPNWRAEEAEKDYQLRQWAIKFVQTFKQDPKDPSSEFYPLYVVSPPPRPSIKLPAIIGTWNPPTSPQAKIDREAGIKAQTSAAAGGGYGGGYGGYGR